MSSATTTAPPEAPLGGETIVKAGVLSLVLLSLGHCFVDIYSGALGALQPLLVERMGLSLTEAGIIGGVFVIASSVLQPAYGYLSDRLHTRMFAALAPAVAGISISVLGMMSGFGWVLALVIVGGTAIAAFHPQASSTVTFGTDPGQRGRWMAIFVSGGTLGFALGPVYFSQAIEWLGVSGIYWAALPGIAVSAFLLWYLPLPPRTLATGAKRLHVAPLLSVWKPLMILYFLVVLRSVVQIVFSQFLALYLNLERGFSYTTANYTLTAYLGAGALGGFFGGYLSDRLGRRRVILLSMAGSVPFLLVFFFSAGVLSIVGLIIGGFVLFFTIPVNVVMAQELAPEQAGTVSALMMGFAWGVAGMIFVPLTGWASDLFSIHHVLVSLLAAPVIGFFLALKLKK